MVRGQRVVYRSTMRELWSAVIMDAHADGLVDIHILKTGVGDAVKLHNQPICEDDDHCACVLPPKEPDASS